MPEKTESACGPSELSSLAVGIPVSYLSPAVSGERVVPQALVRPCHRSLVVGAVGEHSSSGSSDGEEMGQHLCNCNAQ